MCYCKFFISMICLLSSSIAYASNTTVLYNEQSITIQNDLDKAVTLYEKKPDTKALWGFINKQNPLQAQQELIRLKRLIPTWNPDKKLSQALINLSKYTGSPNSPNSIFQNVAQGNKKQWRAMSSTQFKKASNLAFKEKKATHHALMGWVSESRKEYQLAIKHFEEATKEPALNKSAEEGISAAVAGLVSNAVKNRDKEALNNLLLRYPEQDIMKIIKEEAWNSIALGNKKEWRSMSSTQFKKASSLAFKEKKATYNILMGWVAISRKEYELAVQHFEEVKSRDSRKGIAIAVSGLVSNAIKNQDIALLNSLIKRYPNQGIRNKIKSAAWDSIAGGNEKEWQSMSLAKFNNASKVAFKEKNIAHNTLMGWVSMSREEYLLALRHFKESAKNEGGNSRDQEGISAAVNELAYQAIKNQDKASLNSLLSAYPEQNIDAKITSEAWRYYDEEDYQQALNWFEYTQSYPAQVMTLEKMGNKQQALVLACQFSSESTLLDYCINAYSAKQLDFFNQKEFTESLQAAEKIEQYKELDQDQLTLSGWAHYHLNNETESINIFKKLIEKKPNNADYAGVLVNLLDTGSVELEQLAMQYPSIADEINNQSRQLAWNQKQFDRFHALEDQQNTDQQLTIEAGTHWRIQNSENALANLDSQQYFLGFNKYSDQYRFGMRVNYQSVTSETPNIGDDFWQETLTQSFALDNEASETGLSAYIKQQYEYFNTFAELEYWKPEDNLKSSILGKLSGVWYSSNAVTATTLYRERVEDSLLSLMGMYGDETERWGAVTANGFRGLVSYRLQKNWSVSTELDMAILKGEQVEDNTRLSLQLNGVRDFTNLFAEQLDYLRIGPTLNYLTFDDNLNYYTQGNGGYYSPEKYTSLGGKVEFLTLENKHWQIKADVNAFYYWSVPGSVDQYPFDDLSQLISQESESGLGIDWLVEGQWLLTPNWEIAGSISSSFAGSYNETYVGLQLRWNLFDREAMTSDTLISSSPYEADYAWY